MENREYKFQRIFLGLLTTGFITICLISVLFFFTLNKDIEIEDSTEPEIATAIQSHIESEVVENEEPVPITESESIAGIETLEILDNEAIPQRDPLNLAERLKGISSPRVSLAEPPQAYQNGESRFFWILDVDDNEYRQIEAILAYQTDHLYFWIEDDIEFDREEVALLATTFESSIYPTNREFFGVEWTPGVDNDEHLVVIFARRLGGAAGYFSGTDSFMPEVKEYSNQAEMFYLSADYLNLGNSYTYGVLAHEFQHMIHWYQDRNETSWLNEGLSELAVDINGYDTGGFMYLFSFEPDTQLTFWPGDYQGDSSPNYGSSFLFVRYLYSQFGSQVISDIVNSSSNGMISIDESLEAYREDFSADSTFPMGDVIFQNWTIANYLQDNAVGSGEYGYGDFDIIPAFYPVDYLRCDSDWFEGTVNQYGTDYLAIDCLGSFEIEIVTDNTINLLSVDPYSGGHYFWSNYGDESHMRLHRDFDLTNVSGPVTLNYSTWFDIERDYDYVYVTTSIDGEEWTILETTRCTREDPTGANYGCGYNGLSGGWINETVDLSAFAGENVTIQFEYITDAAVNGEGFVIDNISIDAIEYFTDFEDGDAGWQGEGFVLISNQLPQAFSTAVIQIGDESKVVKQISASGMDQVIQVDNQNDQEEIILAISGLTRHTRIPAGYRLRVRQIN